MISTKPKPRNIAIAILFLFIIAPFRHLPAQQVSTFSISGWTPGAAPVFSGTGHNVVNLHYGDSLTTGITFIGAPEDGLGTDHDNVAYMNFSYSYTIYLTPAGDPFSAASIPVGTHTVSADQTCSSGMVPPWTIGYDLQPTMSSDSVGMNVADGIGDCIPPGDYQVDVVINDYAIGTGGPNASSILLQWVAYTNSPARGFSMVSAPDVANAALTTLTPSESYLLGQIAYVHIARPASCPSLTLSLPENINTFAAASPATVVASYAGSCAHNPCTYLWSNGETNPTAVHLISGTYTVTVTAPCGTTASASVTISHHLSRYTEILTECTGQNALSNPSLVNINSDQITPAVAPKSRDKEKNASGHTGDEISASGISLIAYPNPAVNTISFDLASATSDAYSVRVLDLTGKEILMAAKEANSAKLIVNIADLPAGVYIYELISDQTCRGKFVKQ